MALPYRCQRCGMTTANDDLSVVGRNCSATAFEKPHVMRVVADFQSCADVEDHVRTARHTPGDCPWYEPPGPTLAERAQAAQDRVGWAPMATSDSGSTEFASGTVDVARVVTDLAREVERLTALIAAQQDAP